MPVPKALRALEALDTAPDPWPLVAERAAFLGTSMAAAVLLGGSPGVLLLVPGTVGVHGVDQLLAFDVDGGVSTAVHALEVAGALAGGLFAGQGLAIQLDRGLGTRDVVGVEGAP